MNKAKDLEKAIKDFLNLSKGDTASLSELKTFLEKARRRMADEPDEDEEYSSPEEAGMREFDPSEEEGDDADKWLEENEPKNQGEESEDEPEEYNEYAPDEDEEAHQREPEM